MRTKHPKRVHIRISDTGWILEKLAREIAERLPYVTYDLYPDGAADIQYYMTYGCWQQRVSPVEVALFTHKEQVPEAAAKFDDVARRMDFCVAQSKATATILRELGLANVQTISPGVDLERFQPRVRIGVVGRTYHTGRKGEALVASVMDIPGIEWCFTGEGWPAPARPVAEEDLPAFYRSLDYVLVPSLIEGGPMCVLEALACGCPVIGAPVGWVPQFPHIGFKHGDAADLRRVLVAVVEDKLALRRTVEGYTWASWAQAHHELFKKLLHHDPMPNLGTTEHIASAAVVHPAGSLRAIVAVHGQEMTHSLGGPSVRAPRTAAALRRIGVDAHFKSTRNFSPSDVDVVHVLNVWHPHECEALLRQIEKFRRPAVLSPIFLDLTERRFFGDAVLKLLSECNGESELALALSAMRSELGPARYADEGSREPFPGYFAFVRRMMTYTDHVILLSDHERRLLREIGANHPSSSIIKNPVDAELFVRADPRLFREHYGLSEYVLCVSRIEPRKNQALLVAALRGTGVPVVLVGHENPEYSALVRKWADENVLFAGRLEPESPMLASALAGARVFCLPSWAEGAPLAALEAAAAGCNMVLSNRSSEREYFSDHARYVDPADPDDIREKVMEAFNETRPTSKARDLRALLRRENSWEVYAHATHEAYAQARTRYVAREAPKVVRRRQPGRIFIDLTTSAHHDGPPSGIARVEDRLALELKRTGMVEVRYVLWNSAHRSFVEVREDDIQTGRIKKLRGEAGSAMFGDGADQTPYGLVDFRKGDTLLVLGGAWIRNPAYVASLEMVKRAKEMALVCVVYDVIQHKWRSMFPEGIGDEFSQNCTKLLEASDLVLTCSQRSEQDIREFCVEKLVPIPPIKVFRLGDEAASMDLDGQLQEETVALINKTPFVLYVSAIDVRKNHRILLEVWRRLIANHGGSAPALVLVGREGWGAKETTDLLQRYPELHQKVHLMHGINDRTLEWLYNNCLFTVYPSHYEGWGLPVAESLRHGKFCISSNAGALPEVAPDFVDYIDPMDFMGWYMAVEKYSFNPSMLAVKTRRVAEYEPTEWSEVASDLVSTLIDCHASQRLPALRMDCPVDFNAAPAAQSQPASDFMIGGWSKSEARGTWTVGTRAVLAFELDHQPTSSMALRVNASAFVVGGEPVAVTVNINGATLARWSVGPVPCVRIEPIPHTIVDGSRSLRVEFRVANPKSPADLGLSQDKRMLGLLVTSLTLSGRLPEEILDLKVNEWLELPRPEARDAWQLRSPSLRAGTKCIVLAIRKMDPVVLSVVANGTPIGSLNIPRAQDIVRVIRYTADSFDRSEAIALSLSARADAMPELIRLGVFDAPPREALLDAVSQLSHGDGSSTSVAHFPFLGTAPEVEIGATAHVSLGSRITDGLAGGWHPPEGDGTWMDGTAATLHVRPLGQLGNLLSLTVECECLGWLREVGVRFDMAVGTNPGVEIGRSVQDGSGGNMFRNEMLVATSRALDSDGRLALTLRASGAMSPRAAGDSDDSRSLALKLVSISVDSPVSLVDLFWDVPVVFNDAYDYADAFTGGWYEREPAGRWSNGKPSRIAFRLPGIPEQPVSLDLQISPHHRLGSDESMTIRAALGSDPVGTLELRGAGMQSRTLSIPSECLPSDCTEFLLTLSSDSFVPPSEAAAGDSRELSFILHSVTMRGQVEPSGHGSKRKRKTRISSSADT